AVGFPVQRCGDLVVTRYLDAIIARDVADDPHTKIGYEDVLDAVTGAAMPDDPGFAIGIEKRIGFAVDVRSAGPYILSVRLQLFFFLSVSRRSLSRGRGVPAGGLPPLGPIREQVLNGRTLLSFKSPPSPAAFSFFSRHVIRPTHRD